MIVTDKLRIRFEDKKIGVLFLVRSSHRRFLAKKVLLKISQNSQGKTCARVLVYRTIPVVASFVCCFLTLMEGSTIL